MRLKKKMKKSRQFNPGFAVVFLVKTSSDEVKREHVTQQLRNGGRHGACKSGTVNLSSPLNLLGPVRFTETV